MKKHSRQSLLFFFAVTTLTSPSWAQKIHVTKVKGNQAVVEFSGGRLQPGQTYEINSEDLSETTSSARNHLVAVGMTFLNTKSDATGATSDTELSLSGKFGWNRGSVEFGPQASYASQGNGSVTATVLKIGAFGDYNVLANVPGEAFIYGLGGSFDLGQLDSGAGTKTDLMGFLVGPFAKWFPTGSPVGFRLDGGYIYQKASGGATSDRTVTGLSGNISLIAYF